jgi:hypothetical protein
MSKRKQQAKKLYAITAMVFSADLFAQQSLQCQLEREQLVSEYRQQQQSQQQSQQQAFDRAVQLAQMDPMARANAQISMGAYQLGGAIGAAMGGQTLEQRIQDWERRCGR